MLFLYEPGLNDTRRDVAGLRAYMLEGGAPLAVVAAAEAAVEAGATWTVASFWDFPRDVYLEEVPDVAHDALAGAGFYAESRREWVWRRDVGRRDESGPGPDPCATLGCRGAVVYVSCLRDDATWPPAGTRCCLACWRTHLAEARPG